MRIKNMIKKRFVELTPQNLIIIGKNFRTSRKGRGISGKTVAMEFPFSQSYLYTFELGTCKKVLNNSTLAELAGAVGLSPISVFIGCSRTNKPDKQLNGVISILEFFKAYEQHVLETSKKIATDKKIATENYKKPFKISTAHKTQIVGAYRSQILELEKEYPLKHDLNPVFIDVIDSIKGIKLSLKRVEASMNYITRSAYSTGIKQTIPTYSEPEDDKF